MRTVTIAAALALLSAAALAEPIPVVDVDQSCRSTISPRTVYLSFEDRYAICFKEAQASYDKLKFIWGSIDEISQKRCLGRFAWEASIYNDLVLCVEQTHVEQEKARQKAQREEDEYAARRAVVKQEFRY